MSQCLASVLIAAIIAGKLQLGWHAETFQRYNNLNLCKISCAPSIMFDISRTSDLMSKIKCWKITFRKINWVKSRIFTSRHFYLSSGSFISDKLYELVSGTVGRCGNISRTSVVLVVSSHWSSSILTTIYTCLYLKLTLIHNDLHWWVFLRFFANQTTHPSVKIMWDKCPIFWWRQLVYTPTDNGQ